MHTQKKNWWLRCTTTKRNRGNNVTARYGLSRIVLRMLRLKGERKSEQKITHFRTIKIQSAFPEQAISFKKPQNIHTNLLNMFCIFQWKLSHTVEKTSVFIQVMFIFTGSSRLNKFNEESLQPNEMRSFFFFTVSRRLWYAYLCDSKALN